MSTDDKRMHGGNIPGLVSGRGHERDEQPARLDGPEPGDAPAPPLDGPAQDVVRDINKGNADRRQDSALGGHVATQSNTATTCANDEGPSS